MKYKRAEYAAAADEFLKWRKANGVVLNGLVRRREAERALFLSGG
jgi:GH24 family phage-related lysozyme (muramidase)